jgi:hypothetical protein
VGTVALWGTIVEHALGYRARFGYPLQLCLVCPICFWQLGPGRSRAPVVLAALGRRRSMPLCDNHLSTASAVGLSVRSLTPADETLDILLDLYGVSELLVLDATVGSADTGLRSSAPARGDHV